LATSIINNSGGINSIFYLSKKIFGTTVIFFIIIIAAYSNLRAEYLLNFYSGNVAIEIDNKKILIQSGMMLPDKTVIITGKKGIAAVYDSSRNIVINIKSDARINIASIYNSKDIQLRNSIFDKFKKEIPNMKTTVIAVMAQKGSVSDNSMSGKSFKSLKDDRSDEWYLYYKKNYEMAAEKTKGAKDVQGRFIRGASLYYQFGIKQSKESIEELESVILSSEKSLIMFSNTDNPVSVDGDELRLEAGRILSNIYFELGMYDLSYKYISSFVKHHPENEISVISYYIMIVSSRNIGKENEVKIYARKMKKYYPGASLLLKSGL